MIIIVLYLVAITRWKFGFCILCRKSVEISTHFVCLHKIPPLPLANIICRKCDKMSCFGKQDMPVGRVCHIHDWCGLLVSQSDLPLMASMKSWPDAKPMNTIGKGTY